jgi:S-adenosylmethionine:diacylglycerol 3-amino-3-carboxypropyl transferase
MKLVKLQLVGIFELWKIATGGSGGANFLAWLESNADKISDSAFKAKLKDLLD